MMSQSLEPDSGEFYDAGLTSGKDIDIEPEQQEPQLCVIGPQTTITDQVLRQVICKKLYQNPSNCYLDPTQVAKIEKLEISDQRIANLAGLERRPV